MASFLVEAKNQLDIGKKPRVYFTCHPEDFSKYFRKVCDDLFRSHDCAIYYKENMSEAISEEDRATDLGRSNLFVVPVTLKLLTTPNRAMDEDIPFAMENDIPILPIMMESELDAIYVRQDKFGDLQYLSAFSRDATAVPYEEKLKRYLQSVLISDDLASRVRAAFDAYIFLSYRKKDRKYANELMKLVHSFPNCRDIAIWFDEFLTPGENFRENIEKILKDSKLFALLVTPNLLEKPGGKPNYVMGQEYPAAKAAGIQVLPTEMETTNQEALQESFPELPACVNPHNRNLFHAALLNNLSKLATKANDTPEHNFLIGLAYLEGIDVEVNKELGIKLVTFAAEAGLVEAMERLSVFYLTKHSTASKAAYWANRVLSFHTQRYGEEHLKTIASMDRLAKVYTLMGRRKKALELLKQTRKLRNRILGPKHPDTLDSISRLAQTCIKFGMYPDAKRIYYEAYLSRCRVLGYEHPDTLNALQELATNYPLWISTSEDIRTAVKMQQKAYHLHCKVFGQTHRNTLIALNALGAMYHRIGQCEQALKLLNKAYKLTYTEFGAHHPYTVSVLGNIAMVHNTLDDYPNELTLLKKVYTSLLTELGQSHPSTLKFMSRLALAYSNTGEHQKALKLCKKAYALHSKYLYKDHPDIFICQSHLAEIYSNLGNPQKAYEIQDLIYWLSCACFGSKSVYILPILRSWANICIKLGKYQDALDRMERDYADYCDLWGEDHPEIRKTFGLLHEIRTAVGALPQSQGS